MKMLQTFIFIAMALPIFGQTKADFVNCLNIIFDQSEFQPAFSNHESTKGNLIIVTKGSNVSKGTAPTLRDLRYSLTNDDFRFSDHYVKVLRPSELGDLGIPRTAAIEIFVSGSDSEMTINLVSLIWSENQRYSWGYSLIKTGDEWELMDNDLSKSKVNLSTW